MFRVPLEYAKEAGAEVRDLLPGDQVEVYMKKGRQELAHMALLRLVSLVRVKSPLKTRTVKKNCPALRA